MSSHMAITCDRCQTVGAVEPDAPVNAYGVSRTLRKGLSSLKWKFYRDKEHRLYDVCPACVALNEEEGLPDDLKEYVPW